MSLVKSKQRVADHGEVFTPAWMVEAMLDLVKDVVEEINSRVLEPACGSGNYLVPVLRRKLAAVEIRYGQSEFERRHFALLALMCVYGIELLPDNIKECRANLLKVFADYLNLSPSDEQYQAAAYVLSLNIIHGNARSMRTRTEGCKACLPALGLDDVHAKPKHTCQPIRFARWSSWGKGKFVRNDFRLDIITNRSEPLFAHFGGNNVFQPEKTYPPVTVSELAALAPEVLV